VPEGGVGSYNQQLLRTCAQQQVFDVTSRLPQTTDVYYDDLHYTERSAGSPRRSRRI
jgi:hypothetical protein